MQCCSHWTAGRTPWYDDVIAQLDNQYATRAQPISNQVASTTARGVSAFFLQVRVGRFHDERPGLVTQNVELVGLALGV